MVLFKRKPVQFLPAPPIENENDEVWHIPQTGEVFATYDEYLTRMDFFKQRKFICQITGHSGLTYFEAHQSELTGAEEVEQAFPEALKGPVLRRVQFQTVSRIDALVDMMYDEFKADYYPGEAVTVLLITGERLHGVVRDKTRFGSKVLPDGTLTQPFSRYFVSLDNRPDEEASVDETSIFRDRKVFTKSVLRSFIKKTVTREAWNGAPWLVKHDVAEQYRIDTRVPPHLRYSNKLLERKHIQAQKRMLQPHDMNGSANPFQGPGPVRLPELKPAPKSHKSKHSQQQHPQQPPVVKGGRQHSLVSPEPGQFGQQDASGNFQFPVSFRNQGPPPPMYAQPEPPPPPPPPKYPIEDLQLEPREVVRPALKYLCKDPPVDAEVKSPFSDQVLMKSVGPLLETWDTLNVYCEIFKLDSFTFDDFVEALCVHSAAVPIQLFDEMHCAVLKILVKSEADGGTVEIRLPELEEEEDEEEDEEEEEEEEPEPDPEPKPTARATRSSMAKLEAERLAAELAAAEKESQENAAVHDAEEFLKSQPSWIDLLRQRNFKDGGWEMIMVGLLHQLSKNDRQTAPCEELLSRLVPPRSADSATRETVRDAYYDLDINLRVQALQIICMLTTGTKALRGYMEDCSEQMTAYRKEKIEHQRLRKQAIEELKGLNDQRKILLPDNMPPSPQSEPAKVNGDVKMSDGEDLSPAAEDEVIDSDDAPPVSRGRGLRRADDRAAERKRKREEVQERKKEVEAAAKVPKQSKQFLKVLRDIEKKEDLIRKCEEEIAILDNDLREADCPRTRVLGKDRFWNRYYWFERNGMPYGGLPNSSTAVSEYANGCIWVQGPDELERQGYIDMISEYQNEYKAKFDMTVPERKKREEGPTSVFDATQWGYYSEPEELDALLEYLDPRGFNELKLRKELVNFKEKIVKSMEHRKEYLSPAKEEKKEENIRMSTRNNRTRAATTPSLADTVYRSEQWHNSMALEDLGHLHYDQPPPAPPARGRKQGRKKEVVEVIAEPPKKRPSRQGTRYNF